MSVLRRAGVKMAVLRRAARLTEKRHDRLVDALISDAFGVLSHDHGPDEGPQGKWVDAILRKRLADTLARFLGRPPPHPTPPSHDAEK